MAAAVLLGRFIGELKAIEGGNMFGLSVAQAVGRGMFVFSTTSPISGDAKAVAIGVGDGVFNTPPGDFSFCWSSSSSILSFLLPKSRHRLVFDRFLLFFLTESLCGVMFKKVDGENGEASGLVGALGGFLTSEGSNLQMMNTTFFYLIKNNGVRWIHKGFEPLVISNAVLVWQAGRQIGRRVLSGKKTKMEKVDS